MIDKIRCENRIGNDIHKELIAMWKALQSGWVPPSHISEEEYIDVRDNRNKYPDYYVGYVGFHATFGAKYFQGYARGFKDDKVTPRDYSNEEYRNIMKQVPKIQDVKFVCGDYKNNEYSNISDAVVYCDPPYDKTTKFASQKPLKNKDFWGWCRALSKTNFLFVSEYHAPPDFVEIWRGGVKTTLQIHEQQDRLEKLFVYKDGRR